PRAERVLDPVRVRGRDRAAGARRCRRGGAAAERRAGAPEHRPEQERTTHTRTLSPPRGGSGQELVSEVTATQARSQIATRSERSAKPQIHMWPVPIAVATKSPAKRQGTPNASIQRFSSALSAAGVVTR